MKKRIIILSLITFTLTTFSQTYKATYKIKYNNFNRSIKLDTLSEIKKRVYAKMQGEKNEAIGLAEKTELILNFNSKSSFFFTLKSLEVKKGTMSTFKRMFGLRGTYYTNSLKTIEQKNSYGEDFLVSIPKFKWDITNESKKIGNYICYKAITEREIKNYKGTFRIPIVAWFTPELPFNFGPKEYNGLPGLIIQLQQGRSLFYLSSIKKIKDLKIKEPKKGKKITLQEFEKLSKKMFESLKMKSKR